MEVEKIHPSHKMKDNDWGDDRHCVMSCETCGLSHCYICPEGRGLDDDELKAFCLGFRWSEGHWEGDKLIGRRSGTGWPKKKASE